MKKNKTCKIIIIAFLLIIITAISPQNASAQDLSYNLSSTILPVISDKAEILTDYEEVTILNKFTELRDESGFQFIFMTVTDTDEYTKGDEVEAMYNMRHDVLYGTGTVLFLISTDSDNLICEVQAYSQASDILTHEVCSYINGKLRKYVEDGNYFDGVMKFFDYYNQAYSKTLDMSDENKPAEDNSVFSYTINHATTSILIAAVSMLLTVLLYVFIFTAKNNYGDDEKAKKLSHESDIFAGNISYKYMLTSDRITYIRSRVTK